MYYQRSKNGIDEKLLAEVIAHLEDATISNSIGPKVTFQSVKGVYVSDMFTTHVIKFYESGEEAIVETNRRATDHYNFLRRVTQHEGLGSITVPSVLVTYLDDKFLGDNSTKKVVVHMRRVMGNNFREILTQIDFGNEHKKTIGTALLYKAVDDLAYIHSFPPKNLPVVQGGQTSEGIRLGHISNVQQFYDSAQELLIGVDSSRLRQEDFNRFVESAFSLETIDDRLTGNVVNYRDASLNHLCLEGVYEPKDIVRGLSHKSPKAIRRRLNNLTWNIDFDRMSRKEVDLFDLRYITAFALTAVPELAEPIFIRYVLQRGRYRADDFVERRRFERSIDKLESECCVDELKRIPFVEEYLHRFGQNFDLSLMYHMFRRNDYILKKYFQEMQFELAGIKRSIFHPSNLLKKENDLKHEFSQNLLALTQIAASFAKKHDCCAEYLEGFLSTVNTFSAFESFDVEKMCGPVCRVLNALSEASKDASPLS